MYDNLIKLNKTHVNSVGLLLADCFIDNPLMVYFFEDIETRKKVLPRIFTAVPRVMIATGNVYATSENLEGVIGIKREGKSKVNFNLYIAILKSTISLLPLIKDISLIYLLKKTKNIHMDNYPKINKNYFSIEMVAVDKRYRGQKLMSKMVKSCLEEVYLNKSFCILQTETEENVQKYQHLGFELYEKKESIQGKLYHYILIYDPYKILKSH